ncbi:MAG: hypothetical protein BWY79_01711 [Actinobacteria bacterium ADurb.Bin444]|nr:MAG: hypothetical protein BWY79_01711 [Actinobacteria bacterium ADurb.Bin444]
MVVGAEVGEDEAEVLELGTEAVVPGTPPGPQPTTASVEAMANATNVSNTYRCRVPRMIRLLGRRSSPACAAQCARADIIRKFLCSYPGCAGVETS